VQEANREKKMGERDSKRILVVDDDEHQLIMLSDYLEFREFEVIRARSGKEALEKLNTEDPDLVLLDVMMPGMDGGDVAQAIRQDRRFREIPIIFMTAAARKEEVKVHDGLIGGDSFVSKPIDLEDLVTEIRKFLPDGGADSGGADEGR